MPKNPARCGEGGTCNKKSQACPNCEQHQF
jgi:hypothetical protein